MSSAGVVSVESLRPWRRAAVGLSILAALVAGYLGYVSLQLRGTPWGCGAGSGCADVLKSRWSNVAGVPVGFIAASAYVALGAFCGLARGPLSIRLLTVVASSVLSAAIYFVLLQVAVIQSICPWCMLDHALGILTAISGLVIARRQTPRVDPPDLQTRDPHADPVESSRLPPRSSAVGSVATGVGLSLVFIGVQHFTAKSPDVARVQSGSADVEGSKDALKLTLKNGEALLPAASLPVLGPSTASHRLILMFDYCCQHCREAHHLIRRLQPTAGETWQVVFVPVPLNAECNPGVEETEPRFKDACTLARLSLAVWRLRPDDWPAFDEWLFEPEMPRTADEARRHAAAVYGEIELAEVLARPAIDEAIAANVRAYQVSASRVLPVILSPGTAGIAGRTDGEDELRTILKQEFAYPAP